MGACLRLLQALEWGRACAKAYISNRQQELTPPTALIKEEETQMLTRAMLCEEQLAFCRGVLEILPDFGLDTQEEPLPPAAPRVAFLDGFFSREALRRFERLLPRARAVTVSSFTAVCEEIASGNADLALLPLEDSREGKFLHLFEEIERFELHISHACDVSYPDEGRTVTVGLISRLYRPVARIRGEQMLALSVFEEHPGTLCELLQAAKAAGLELRRVDSLPAPYGANGMFYHPVFRTKEQDERLFEAYLALFMPRTRITGRYVHLIK